MSSLCNNEIWHIFDYQNHCVCPFSCSKIFGLSWMIIKRLTSKIIHWSSRISFFIKHITWLALSKNIDQQCNQYTFKTFVTKNELTQVLIQLTFGISNWKLIIVKNVSKTYEENQSW